MWKREGDMPETVKVVLTVSKKKHPELAEWIWNLPYHKATTIVRETLNNAIRLERQRMTPQPIADKPAIADKPVATNDNTTVNSETIELMRSFKEMF